MLGFVAQSWAQSITTLDQSIENGFKIPPRESHPETWFHLIGGNVNPSALTADLEAIQRSGIRGIQLFHGRGRPWPGVKPQIQTLSPTWDSLISQIANETQRLGLNFTMQNCPGWAMSGGPWITPDKAMRHLVVSRINVRGGRPISMKLATPQPSQEDWRDYRDIAVLAFPSGLKHARGKVPTPLGPIEIQWKNEDSFKLSLTLPQGMSAGIDLPATAESAAVYCDGNQIAATKEGDRWIVTEPVNGSVTFEVK